MKILLTTIVCLLVSLNVRASGSQHKGYVKLNRLLFSEVFKINGTTNHIVEFLGNPAGAYGLLELLGYYPSGLNHGEMTNGDPNAISLLTHYFVFNGAANKMSVDCSQIEDPIIRDGYQTSFLSRLESLCLLPVSEVVDEELASGIWNQFHGFLAPYNEFTQWYNHHSSITYQDSGKRVHAMVLSTMMNPYFFINN